MGGRQRQDHVLAVARDDHQRAGTHALEHVAGSIAPIATPSMTRSTYRAGVDRLAVDTLEDHPEGRVREDRPDREHAQERDAIPCEAAVEDRRNPRLGIDVDLVHDRAGDLDPVFPRTARRRERSRRSAGRSRPRRRSPPGSRASGRPPRSRAHHRSDAGVSRALDEQHLVTVERLVGGPDSRPEVLHYIARDVGLREAARDVDRAHDRGLFGSPNVSFMRTASSSAGSPSSMTVRCPTA